jgi:hypothetical protein
VSPPPPGAGWASPSPPPLLDAGDVRSGMGPAWARETECRRRRQDARKPEVLIDDVGLVSPEFMALTSPTTLVSTHTFFFLPSNTS